MPEAGGTYILSLSVANGDVTTSASVLVVDPAGATPTVTPTGSDESWEAVVSVATAGWWLATWTVTGAGQGVKSQRFYVTPTPTAWAVWPPCLADLKADAGRAVDDQDDTEDGALAMVLDAAIVKVVELKGDSFDLDDDPEGESGESGVRAAPDSALILGTIRLARRWHDRRRSPDGSAVMAGELGTARIPAFDPDIERMLRIGRYSRPQDQFA